MKFLIEGVIIDFDEIAIANLYHEVTPDPTWDNVKPDPIAVVRIQLKNRRDEIREINGKPVQVKHGVFELSSEGSEMFRWWVKVFGPRSLNIQDVDQLFMNRVKVEAMIREQETAMFNQMKKEIEK